MKINKENYILLTGNRNPQLAADIGMLLMKDIVNPARKFKDGETRIINMPNVRDKKVYIIQPTAPHVNDALMELMLMIDAARRASAKKIVAVIPYFGYARQDRKAKPREPISSAVVANMIIHAGADHILTVDIHAAQIQGSIKQPWDNIYASTVLVAELKKRENISNTVIVSPDKGGLHRATAYADMLGIKNVALVYKTRDVKLDNKARAYAMIGDVKGKDVIIVDDIYDSGSTILSAAQFLIQNGAQKVTAVVSHGLFSGDALEKLTESRIEEVIITDSVEARDDVKRNHKIKIVTIAPLLTTAIEHLETGESISAL